jgi:hypothetical protein
VGLSYSTHGRDDEYVKIVVGKPEGKRFLARTCRRWEDNIGMDLREIRWEVVC